MLKETFGTVPETVMPECNTVLLRTGSDLILVDSGSGPGFQPTAGQLLAHLAANGIDPASVTKVVGSPMDIRTTSGAPGPATEASPSRTTYYVDGTEFDFWTNPDTLAAFPEEFKPIVTGAVANLTTVEPKMVRVKDGDSIAPGISVVTAPQARRGTCAAAGWQGRSVADRGCLRQSLAERPRIPTGCSASTRCPSRVSPHPQGAAGPDRHRQDADPRLSLPLAGVGRIERAGDGYRFVAAG